MIHYNLINYLIDDMGLCNSRSLECTECLRDIKRGKTCRKFTAVETNYEGAAKAGAVIGLLVGSTAAVAIVTTTGGAGALIALEAGELAVIGVSTATTALIGGVLGGATANNRMC